MVKPKTLKWTLNTDADAVSSYQVYRDKKPSPILVGTVNGVTDHMDVSNAIKGNRTTFYIHAENVAGPSEPSDKVTIQK